METFSNFVKLFKKDPVTTFCGVLFAITYYITNNQDSISFLGDPYSSFVIKACEFLRGASVSLGLIFATESKSK